ILDGGFATELEAAGFHLQDDPLWSARILHTNPQAIKDVHARFLSGGADVISTATYQATVEGFVRHLGVSSEDAVQLLHLAVTLAKEAVEEFCSQNKVNLVGKGKRTLIVGNWIIVGCTVAQRKLLIAGSVGPYGAFLHDGSEYTGSYVDLMSIEEIKAWHRVQIQPLVSAGVDLIAMETIPSQKEGEALVELLREFPNTVSWLSFSCKDEQHTHHGEKFEEAVKIVNKSRNLVAVGVNCCAPTLISPLLTAANKNKNPDIDWIVYPNSGEEWKRSSG
uniref:Zgc:172121 n=1 Tax=Latimeria chalumnae TaxID=7897 RepID=H3APQ6_LATCH